MENRSTPKTEEIGLLLKKRDVNTFIESGSAYVAPVIQYLKQKENDLRSEAASVLGEIGDPMAVDTLIESLEMSTSGTLIDSLKMLLRKGVSFTVCRNAALALGKIGDVRAVEPLIACLYKDDYDLRCNAIIALGQIRDARAVIP